MTYVNWALLWINVLHQLWWKLSVSNFNRICDVVHGISGIVHL